jgi:hypothetical protein
MDDGSEPPPDFNGFAEQASFRQGFAIHHYITKSREQCFAKIARGRPRPESKGNKYRPPSYWRTYNRNEVKDPRAAEVMAPIRDDVIGLRETIGRD